jgi:hypothetical protein
MIKRCVAPHAPGQLIPRVESQGESRNRRTEDIADNRHQAIGDRYRPEARQGEESYGPYRKHGQREHDDSPFCAGRVDRGANRRLGS